MIIKRAIFISAIAVFCALTIRTAANAGDTALPTNQPPTTQSSEPDTPEKAEKEIAVAVQKGDVALLVRRTLFDTSDKSDHRAEVKEGLAKLAEDPSKTTFLEVHQVGDCAAVLIKRDPPRDHHAVDYDLFIKIDGHWLLPSDKPDDNQLTQQQWKQMGDVMEWGQARCEELDPKAWPMKAFHAATQP